MDIEHAWILGTLTVNGRTYSERDIVKIDLDPVDDRLYGGRVRKIGTTNTDVILLLDKNMKAFDTAVMDLESLDTVILKDMSYRKKLKHRPFISKEDLIDLILGKAVEKPEKKPDQLKKPRRKKAPEALQILPGAGLNAPCGKENPINKPG